MAEPGLIDYYRDKVIAFQVEAATTDEGPNRSAALIKMSEFYIEQIEKAHEEST